MSVKLFIIATPIGNLSDLSERTINTLKEVDLIFAEDTRVSVKLLYHLGLRKKMVSCHKFNERARIEELQRAYDQGLTVALMSDAGTPLVSDPGNRIVEEAIKIGFDVCAIPGPTACIQALVGSGLPVNRFSFEGFLPEKKGELKRHLFSIKDDPRTLVFYISPHNLVKRLEQIQEVLGNRRACLAKELTKFHEQYIRADLGSLKDHLNSENLRGEFTLVVEGCEQISGSIASIDEAVITDFILANRELGLSVNEIAKACSKDFFMKKSEAYKRVLEICQRD